MKIADLMNTTLYIVSPESSVESAVRMLHQRGVRHLVVLDKDELVGILSDRDLKRTMDPEQRHHRKMLNLGGLYFLLEPFYIREIMTKDPITISPDATAQEAATVMVKNRFGALPVVKNGKLLGIVTESDLLRYFASVESEPQAKGGTALSAKPKQKARQTGKQAGKPR